jgi:uncharacterized membrane protein
VTNITIAEKCEPETNCPTDHAKVTRWRGKERKQMETRARTLVKSIVWTLVGLVSMILVGLAFTGSVAIGGAMAVVNAVLGFACYLLYERIWARISWGRDV